MGRHLVILGLVAAIATVGSLGLADAADPAPGLADEPAASAPGSEPVEEAQAATASATEGASSAAGAAAPADGSVTPAAAVQSVPDELRERAQQVAPANPVATTLERLTALGDPPSAEDEDGAPGGANPEAPGTAAASGAAASPTGDEDAPTPIVAGAAAVATAATGAAARIPGLRRVLRVAPLAGLYSRIARDEVLDHETRREIFDLLKREPGRSVGELADAVDASRSTVRHHLRKLDQAGVVEHQRLGRSRIHFPVGREAEARARHLLENETRARVAAALADEPRTLTEVAERLDANAGSVHFHLEKLCEADLVERCEGEATTYRAAADRVRDHVAFPAR